MNEADERIRAAQEQAWDLGYACGLGDYGKRDDETVAFNPYACIDKRIDDMQ